MSAIKLPSSNIYEIDDTNLLIKNNKITKATISPNEFEEEYGNISSPEYVINFWEEVDASKEDTELEYVGGKNSNVKLVPVIPSDYDTVDIQEVISRIQTDKTLLLNCNEEGLVKGHKAKLTVRERIAVDKDGKRIISYNTFTNYLPTLKYFPEDNTFWAGVNPRIDTHSPYYSVVDDASGERWLLSYTITVEGTYYVPKQVAKEFGSGTYVFDLPSNELVQDLNLIEIEGSSDIFVNLVLQNVVNKYSKGKEVYEIKCSVANYYDTNHDLVICPTNTDYPAIFQKHDIIEPYIYTSKGEVPLSVNSDETPKQFEIIGIDYSYQGVVWQNLTIQEYVI